MARDMDWSTAVTLAPNGTPRVDSDVSNEPSLANLRQRIAAGLANVYDPQLEGGVSAELASDVVPASGKTLTCVGTSQVKGHCSDLGYRMEYTYRFLLEA